MIYEIRNYHFDPERLEEYKAWAQEKALPFLNRKLDLVGFWTNAGDSEVIGEPMDELGSANITWIIRWPDRGTRDTTMGTLFEEDEWAEIFADVPGGLDSYQRREAKFSEALI